MDDKCFNLIKKCVSRGSFEMSPYGEAYSVPALTLSNLLAENLYLNILRRLFPDMNNDIYIRNWSDVCICGEINHEVFNQIQANTDWNFEIIEKEVLSFLPFYAWLSQEEPSIEDRIASQISNLSDNGYGDDTFLSLDFMTDILSITVPYKAFHTLKYTFEWLLENKETFVSAVKKYFTDTYGEIGSVMTDQICDALVDDLEYYWCFCEQCMFISHPSLGRYINEHNDPDILSWLDLACLLSETFCSGYFKHLPQQKKSSAFTCVNFFAPFCVDGYDFREYDFGYDNISMLALLLLDELAKRGEHYAV